MSVKLFVGNLASETTSQDVHALFSALGAVTSCQVIVERDTGRSKGFGFVEMDDAAAAHAAKAQLNGHALHGKPLKVDEARPRGER